MAKLMQNYLVAAIGDVNFALDPNEYTEFMRLLAKCEAYRIQQGKERLKGIFLKESYPEYQGAVASLLARADHEDLCRALKQVLSGPVMLAPFAGGYVKAIELHDTHRAILSRLMQVESERYSPPAKSWDGAKGTRNNQDMEDQS